MPPNGATIGGVVRRWPDSYLWAIPGFSELSKFSGPSNKEREITWFRSPLIYLGETRWILQIFPNGAKSISEYMCLALMRHDGGPAETFECAFHVRSADGRGQPVGCRTVKLGRGYTTQVFYPYCRYAGECVEGEFLSSDTLTIALSLRKLEDEGQGNDEDEEEDDDEEEDEDEEEDDWQGNDEDEGQDYCTFGTQTEDLESMTDPEDESPEAKGMKFLTTHMRELLMKSDDYDIRFQVQGREFQAHRNILKARCPVFSMMLTHDTQENRSGVICIEDCDADAFGIFLSYVYLGKVEDLTTKKAADLYSIAKKYNFTTLQELCVSFIRKSLSETTVHDVILFCAVHDEMNLMKMTTHFFIEHINEILVTAEWQNFMINHPVEANQLCIKYVKMSQNK